jgi:hypothetical protein
MNLDKAAVGQQFSITVKVLYGVLFPIALFIAYQLALIKSASGTGQWDGMMIFFGSIVIVPGLLVANCWVIPVRWQRKGRAFLAGLALPAVIGVIEYFWLHGGSTKRAAIEAALEAIWPWPLLVLMVIPLLVSIAHTVFRSK